MSIKYFVMINTHAGIPVPMEEDEEVVLFEDELDAISAAKTNSLARACGYMVYPWDSDKAEIEGI